MEPVASVTLRLSRPAETRAMGERLAAALRPGDFIGLAGALGAGKTLLSRAICEALGVPSGEIASPTFAIVHPYRGGRLPVQHADLYRVSDFDELYATGFLDLVDGNAVAIVEWIDRVPEAAPPEWLRIELRHDEEPRSRTALVQGFGARGEALVAALAAGA
ncbi:MAG TPA: tRNA (adenosine(37)-N6)-threonylcarbamoyltransferase complex ATPase subunit type 1 TsaE [Vulgatibacter sp.]|nr:tRNA (adenosine(37)-N6)-threonylcarbamoyltransferase complex ATPase subunit type 1 TsaE [Vulgatibacter sp.]